MIKIIVKIGPYEFEKDFHDESAGLECFDSIAASPDGEVHNGHLIMPASALVDAIELRRLNIGPSGVVYPIGDPRQGT